MHRVKYVENYSSCIGSYISVYSSVYHLQTKNTYRELGCYALKRVDISSGSHVKKIKIKLMDTARCDDKQLSSLVCHTGVNRDSNDVQRH